MRNHVEAPVVQPVSVPSRRGPPNLTPWIACLAIGLVVGFFFRGPSERIVERIVEVEKVVEVPVEVEKVVEVPVVTEKVVEKKVYVPGLFRVNGRWLRRGNILESLLERIPGEAGYDTQIPDGDGHRLAVARAAALYRVGATLCEAGLRLGLRDTNLVIRTSTEDVLVLREMKRFLDTKRRFKDTYQFTHGWKRVIEWSDEFLECLGWRGMSIAITSKYVPYPPDVEPARMQGNARNMVPRGR